MQTPDGNTKIKSELLLIDWIEVKITSPSQLLKVNSLPQSSKPLGIIVPLPEVNERVNSLDS